MLETTLEVTVEKLSRDEANRLHGIPSGVDSRTPFVVPLPHGEVTFPAGSLWKDHSRVRRSDEGIEGVRTSPDYMPSTYDVTLYFKAKAADPDTQSGWDFAEMIGPAFRAVLDTHVGGVVRMVNGERVAYR